MASGDVRRPLTLQMRWTLLHGVALLVAVTIFGVYTYERVSRRLEQDAELLLALQADQSLADLARHRNDAPSLEAAIRARTAAADPELKLGIAVYAPDGAPRFADGALAGFPLPVPSQVLNRADDQAFGEVDLGGRYGWRVVTERGEAGIAQIAIYGRRLERAVQAVGRIFWVAIPAVLLLSGLAGHWLARTSLRPIAEIAATARRISGSRLDERIPRSGTGDELDQLATTLNDAFARLRESLERTRGFAGDAAHELRTPLAALRSQIEVTLEKERSGDEYRATLAGLHGEVERLAASVQAMLRLARTEAGLDPARRVPVPLAELLRDVAGFFEPVAEEHGIALRVGALPALMVPGDAEWLHQLFANLLHNAIRYTPRGGEVTLSLDADAAQARVRVRDTGPGIPADEQSRVFERFHRVDARSDRPGTGLGLPIAREIARAHGGAIALASEPGAGCTFTVLLPRAPDRARAAYRSASACGVVLVVLLGLACGDATRRGSAPPPLPGELISSFLALGDTGEPTFLPALRSGQRAVARGMALEDARQPVGALVLLGDNFYPDGLREASLVEQTRDHLVLPYCRFFRLDGPRSGEVASACPGGAVAPRRPVFAVLGNHDYGDPVSPGLQRDALPAFVPSFDLPPGVASLRRLGDGIDLVLVDSELLLEGADATPLRDALRASAGPWRVLALHRPVALANGQQTDPAGAEMKLRETIRAAVSDAGVRVQLTLAGHTHDMQVLVEPDPMPLHVVAGSGASGRAAKPGTESRRFAMRALGFARVDRVRTREGERLVATLFETPRYPAFQGTLEAPVTAVARWSVGLDGSVRDELAGSPSR